MKEEIRIGENGEIDPDSAVFESKGVVDLPGLAVTLSNALVTLSGQQCQSLQGPIVYALFRNGVAWYVGMSGAGITRALTTGNSQIAGFCPGDNIYIWSCETVKEACSLEQDLIEAWNPQANKAVPTPIRERCDHCGGEILHTVTRGSARKYCSHKCRSRAYRQRKEGEKLERRVDADRNIAKLLCPECSE